MADEDTKSFFRKQYATVRNDLKAADAAAQMAVSSSSAAAEEQMNSKLWKNFGCDTEAGRVLRSLYRQPLNAQVLKHVPQPRSTNTSRFSTDSVMESEKQKNLSKRCPQRDGQVAVPRVGTKKPDHAQPIATRGKKTLDHILEENNGFIEKRCAVPPVKKGRDNIALKEQLQNKFTYGEAYMNPIQLRERREKREAEQQAYLQDHHHLGKADVQLLNELEQDIKEKEDKLAEIDAKLERQLGRPADREAWKARIVDDKLALELETDLERDKKDLRDFKRLNDLPK